MAKKFQQKITKSSTAEYFAKNLQQVGFSSPVKAVLTTLKEAVDNALDACEDHHILPYISIIIEKLGPGALRNSDRIMVQVEDNGPGLDVAHVPMVFGEYLASSKFGRGRCSRGQQGIGISAATTWAVQTSATGAKVKTKRKNMKKALSCMVVTDLKNNKGVIKEKEMVLWDKPHGTCVSFQFDGRLQINGEGGILAYLRGNILLNPHMTLTYKLPDMEAVTVERIVEDIPIIPPALPPHPHTMKLGEFISHAHLFPSKNVTDWLKNGFSRISERVALEILAAANWRQKDGKKMVSSLSNGDLKELFTGLQKSNLQAPSTQSVMSVGEEALSLSIQRIGELDYFSVVTRKPVICDMKPVQIEVALARLLGSPAGDSENPIQVLRFANRVPLQFDKASCAIVKAISTVNWKTYGLRQTRGLLPAGPYIIAVSIVSPFIKFKNASKETIDAADELVEEIRRALMKAGLRLSRHLKREHKAKELEAKTQKIEMFSPILVDTLCRILNAPKKRKVKAVEGLNKILGRDSKETKKQLQSAEEKLSKHLEMQKKRLSVFSEEDKKLKKLEQKDLLDEMESASQGNSVSSSSGEDKVVNKKKSAAKKKVVKKKSQTKKKTATKKNESKKKTAKKKKVVKKKSQTKKKTATKKKVSKKKESKKKKTVKKKSKTKKTATKKKVNKKKTSKKKKTVKKKSSKATKNTENPSKKASGKKKKTKKNKK